VRLVTLTGPGGTGKTRLALHIAAALHGDFLDGIAFVALASIKAPTLVVPAIAKALGVIDAGDQLLLVRLGHVLHDRRLLLLLPSAQAFPPSSAADDAE